MVLQAIRSAIFYLILFVFTALLAIGAILFTPLPAAQLRVTRAFATTWTAVMRFLLRYLVGIRTVVEGSEHIPTDGALIAAKHQSDWDVVALYPLLDHPAFIAKKELFDIPVFGSALRTLGIIMIDRSKGGRGIAGMIEDARRVVATGRNIFIFPEGTRRAPFAEPNYRFGTARLYESLNVPLVPVALNSGLCWGRNSLILWPGTARARFLEPIPPGLSAEEVHKLYAGRIEAVSRDLGLQAVDKGLTRPIDDKLRDRIAAARAAGAASEPDAGT